MTLSRDDMIRQVNDFLVKYPQMKIREVSENSICLEGEILVHRSVNDYTLRKKYTLQILIPIESEQLPYVVDLGKSINETYPHRYTNGILCLETDATIKYRFSDGFDLIAWMNEYVEPYYLSYEYYQLYGVFPFGERSHGVLGIMESYQDLLHGKDISEVTTIAEHIIKHKYRGHLDCPCGSGERIRNCHGPYMIPFYKNESLRHQLTIDLSEWYDFLGEYKRRYGRNKHLKTTKSGRYVETAVRCKASL